MEAARAAKDDRFRNDPDSPVPPHARAAFRGLAYFPIDEAYRVTARVERLPSPQRVRVVASGGDVRDYERACVLRFELRGRALSLAGFVPEEGQSDEPYLFVPFQDATSGKESYGGGRYLDPDVPSGPTLSIDFNEAYHPYCVYDDSWSCVIPPPENRLPIAVRAGERLPDPRGATPPR